MSTNRSNNSNNDDDGDDVGRDDVRVENADATNEAAANNDDSNSNDSSSRTRVIGLCWETMGQRLMMGTPKVHTLFQIQLIRDYPPNRAYAARYTAAFVQSVGIQTRYVVAYLDYMKEREYSKIKKLVRMELSAAAVPVILCDDEDYVAKDYCDRKKVEMRNQLVQYMRSKKYSKAKSLLQLELSILQSFEV